MQYIERLVEREIEQEIEVPRYVEVETKTELHRKHVVEQHQRTIEVTREKVVDKIIERKKPIIQERIVHVPKCLPTPRVCVRLFLKSRH